MKYVKDKVLTLLSSGLFLIALQAVNMYSYNHIYQAKEPESLKKYEKYLKWRFIKIGFDLML